MKTKKLLAALWRLLQAALCACLLYAFSQAFIGTPRGPHGPEVLPPSPAVAERQETPHGSEDRLSKTPAPKETEESPWRKVSPGVEYAAFRSEYGGSLHVARIDPQKCEFVLCSAAREGEGPKTLGEWAEAKHLDSAINASMYLPDGKTSTGLMRDGAYVNNSRMVRSFGGFFAAGPKYPSLPKARIIERGETGWKETLSDYSLVIQNYRIVGTGGKIFWGRKEKPSSISAIGEDIRGRLLFVFCRERCFPEDLAHALTSLHLEIDRLIYAEGGAQAGLFVKPLGEPKEMSGKSALGDFVPKIDFAARIPNALGVRSEDESKEPEPDSPSSGQPAEPEKEENGPPKQTPCK